MSNAETIKKLYKLMSPCFLCPLNCGVERLKGETGICNSDATIRISSYTLYRGEEPPLSGEKGSGAIFFSNCNLNCVYCQNYNFSQYGSGKAITLHELSRIMLNLQAMGAANINLITATHFLPQSIAALAISRRQGMNLPVLLNTSGYESVEVIKLLEGFIDIYLPDFRYSSDELGEKYSEVPFIPEFTVAAIREMLKQVGRVEFDAKGVMKRGVVIRLLLFPGGIEELRNILDIIKREFSNDVFISLMSQYVPVYRAKNFTRINRKLNRLEIMKAIRILREEGFKNGWVQYD